MKSGAPSKVLATADSERLAQLRQQAADELRAAAAAVVAKRPDATLDALAWIAGAMGANPDDPAILRDLITQARDERLSWREIADAVGEGDSQSDARRLRDRYSRLWAQ